MIEVEPPKDRLFKSEVKKKKKKKWGCLNKTKTCIVSYSIEERGEKVQ